MHCCTGMVSGGCQQTVEIMSRLATTGLKNMDRQKSDPDETVDLTKLSNGLCSRKEFTRFQPFVEDSCIKILNEHKLHFLNIFAGMLMILACDVIYRMCCS